MMADQDNIFLPSLKELRELNANAICPEVAWIWGPNDEVSCKSPNPLSNSLSKLTSTGIYPWTGWPAKPSD